MKKNQLHEIQQEIEKRLPVVFFKSLFRKELNYLQERLGLEGPAKMRIFRAAKKIPLYWSGRPPMMELMSFKKNVDIIEVIEGICCSSDRYCISHGHALYLHGLIDQRPKIFYLSKEVPHRTSVHTKNYNQDLIRLEFMKPPRKTKNFFRFKDVTVFFIEKQDLGKLGLKKKTIYLPDKSVRLIVPNLERSLIDSVIAPQYSGGITTVINCFKKSKINIDSLFKVYKEYHFFYPYWQRIGLILEKTKGPRIGSLWRDRFKNKKIIEFFIDRGYKKDWEFSNSWGIYHQKDIFQ